MRGIAQDHGFAHLSPLGLRDFPWRRALWILPILAPDMRPTILLAFDDVVEFLRLHVVAKEINAVIHPPQFAGLRIPSEAQGVAQSTRKDRAALAVRRGAQQGRVLRIGFIAGVARGTHADIQHAVRAERQRPVGVLPAVREIIDDSLNGSQRPIGVERRPEHFGRRGHVEVAVADGQSMDTRTVGHGPRGFIQDSILVGVL